MLSDNQILNIFNSITSLDDLMLRKLKKKKLFSNSSYLSKIIYCNIELKNYSNR